MAIALASLASCALFGRCPAVAYIPAILAMAAFAFWLSWHLFTMGYFVSPAYVILAMIISGMIILPIRFWRSERSRRKIRESFGRYISPAVVQRFVASSEKLGGEDRELKDILDGQEKVLTVMFTDIRDFTSISEKMAFRDLVAMHKDYFTIMTDIVRARQGTVDKYIGDALMAFWNAPLDADGNHQLLAVEAAIRMREELATRQEHFRGYFRDVLPGGELRMGIGIHCDRVHVGDIGSKDAANYTCIGNGVNLASRLEGLCKRYGTGIIVSGAIRRACGNRIRFRLLDRVSVKGQSAVISIFTPVPRVYRDDLERKWRKGMAAYLRGDFKRAIGIFEKLGEEEWDGRVAARMLSLRCQGLLGKPWEGYWAYDSK